MFEVSFRNKGHNVSPIFSCALLNFVGFSIFFWRFSTSYAMTKGHRMKPNGSIYMYSTAFQHYCVGVWWD
jgi:hypothetical protein